MSRSSALSQLARGGYPCVHLERVDALGVGDDHGHVRGEEVSRASFCQTLYRCQSQVLVPRVVVALELQPSLLVMISGCRCAGEWEETGNRK